METITETVLNICKKERETFMQENGREPTEPEATRMAEMITRQFQIAHTMLR
jgi:hypothetical protein